MKKQLISVLSAILFCIGVIFCFNISLTAFAEEDMSPDGIPIKGIFSQSDIKKLNNPITYIVTCRDGIPMYAGPSTMPEKTGTIPDGAEITLSYTDAKTSSFYYTEYNGQEGWVLHNTCDNPIYMHFSLLRKLDDNSLYTGKLKVTGNNLHLLDVTSEETDENGNFTGYKEVSDVIPVGTELTFSGYYDDYDYWALVEYNGIKGCVLMQPYIEQEDEIGVICYINDEMMTLTDCTVFSDLNDFESKTGETVPAYTQLPLKAVKEFTKKNENDGSVTIYRWFLAEYSGREVWLCNNHNNEEAASLHRHTESYSYYRINSDSAGLHKTGEADSAVVYTADKNDILKKLIDRGSMLYVGVVGSDTEGWIDTDAVEYTDNLIVPPEQEPDADEAVESTENDPESTAIAQEKKDQTLEIEKSANSSPIIIIACAVVAVIGAVDAGVGIVKIKKKKKTVEN